MFKQAEYSLKFWADFGAIVPYTFVLPGLHSFECTYLYGCRKQKGLLHVQQAIKKNAIESSYSVPFIVSNFNRSASHCFRFLRAWSA